MDGCRAATPRASHSGGWRADDSELGVFTAERYFNGALAAEDALWCDRSPSSFSPEFKSRQHEGSAPTPTAATSSSEASWNSRSALLPNRPVVAATSAVEVKPNSRTASEQTGRKPPSSSHLRLWLLGLAGCACACGNNEESASTELCRDEVETGSVHGGEKHSTEADEISPRRTSKHTAMEDVSTVSAMPSRWADDGDAFLAGTATQPPLQLAESGQRRGLATSSRELSMRVMNSTTTTSFDEQWREPLDMFRPAGQGSTLVSAKQNSAFTIVAGSTAWGRAVTADTPHRACSSRRDSGVDDAAPSELECMYPPSEASVVWSVATAEGAASGNFSSAASGCYYYYNDCDEAALRHAAAGTKSNRPRSSRSRINGSGLLMGCMSKGAVDAIGPPRT